MPWAEMILFGSPIFPAPRFGEAEEQRQLLVLRLRERQGRQLWQSKNSVYHRGSVSVAGPHNVYHESCGKLHSDWKYQAGLGTEGKLIGSGNDIWRLGNLAIALTHVHIYIWVNMEWCLVRVTIPKLSYFRRVNYSRFSRDHHKGQWESWFPHCRLYPHVFNGENNKLVRTWEVTPFLGQT